MIDPVQLWPAGVPGLTRAELRRLARSCDRKAIAKRAADMKARAVKAAARRARGGRS